MRGHGRFLRCAVIIQSSLLRYHLGARTEAQDWSIWRWLMEKSRVRNAADKGTAALDELEKNVKAGWPKELKAAYKAASRDSEDHLAILARRVKDADDRAYRARMDAEETFDEAERRLSAGLAREGARKAILAYELREKAIRRAEAAGRLDNK